MKANLFISYSHKDKEHKEQLDTHLSLLKRNKIIDTWSDRCITAGEEWEKEIDKNLEDADIIIFLISPDFIASDYCYDIELTRAIDKHNNQEAVTIPVIIRHCDWKTAPFGKLQALPESVKPVSSWNDIDEAWLNVISGLKDTIKKISKKELVSKDKHVKGKVKTHMLTKEFSTWLHDTEISLAHRRIDYVSLDDVYVFPDLKQLDSDLNKLSKITDSSNKKIISGYVHIFGDEQTGKTSLAKKLFNELLNNNKSPIFISGEDIKSSNIEDIIKRQLKKQYLDCDSVSYLEQDEKSIVIDDYSNTKLNKKYQNILIENLKKTFNTIVILSSESFQYVVPEIIAFDNFTNYEIQLFGNAKRSELIQKWVEIGVKEEITDQQLYLNLDTLKTHIDTFVKKNIVPSKPIHLLTILQTVESYTPLGVELTSSGHCYQFLIYSALEKINIKAKELDTYINFLTEIAGYIFSKKSGFVTDGEMELFISEYKNKYLIDDHKTFLNNLISCSILASENEIVRFKYRYIYYFYAAKFLAENLHKDKESKQQIQHLIQNLHKEDSANIIIFITHHTKDSWILDEIQLCMMELFESDSEAELNNDELDFMSEFLEKIPALVIEQREIAQERNTQDKNKDEAEKIENEIDKHVNELEPSDILAQINRSFKGIELIGNIARNRYGSLDRRTLTTLLEQAYSVGLRFLKYFLNISDAAKADVIESIKHMLLENPKIDNSKLEKEAKNLFMMITYGTIFGIIRKIAFSVGAKETNEIYLEIQKKMNTPAVKLINQSIELQFMKIINTKQLKSLAMDFENNIVCGRILKEIMVQHIYMHHIDYKEKQQISEILNLPIEKSILLESQKN